jgi:isopenicillin N synthase-like dioxygenase
MIPKIDLQALVANDAGANRDLLAGIQECGFLIVHNTSLSAADVVQVTDMYRQVFPSARAEKGACQHGKNGIKSWLGCLGQ